MHPTLPWSTLVDLDAATQWCARRPLARMEAMTPQALVFLTGQLLAESRRLLEAHWDPTRAALPVQALRPFRESIALSFEALMLACVSARRACPDAVAPAPSLQLSLATFAREMDDQHAGQPLPADLLAGLAEVEAARQEFLVQGFSPAATRAGQPAHGPTLEPSCRALCVAVGRLLAAVDGACPCALMPREVASPVEAPIATSLPDQAPGHDEGAPTVPA